jgi:hypothetical protein
MKRGWIAVLLVSGCQSVVGVEDSDSGPTDAGREVHDAYSPGADDAGGDAFVPIDGGPSLCSTDIETWDETVRDADTGDHCPFDGTCGGNVYLSETDLTADYLFAECLSSTLLLAFMYRECGETNEHTWTESECEAALDTGHDRDRCTMDDEGRSWACGRVGEDCCFEFALCQPLGLSRGRVCNDNCEYAQEGGRVHDECPADGDWVVGEPCIGDWSCPDVEAIASFPSNWLACDGGVLRATPRLHLGLLHRAPCWGEP